MIWIKYLILAIMLMLALTSYAVSDEQTIDDLQKKIFAIAKKKLQDGNWKQAISQLKILDSYYLFSPDSQEVQLDLIYSYYKNNDLNLAKIAIDRFMRLNPTHPNIDYVIYMRGLITMELDNNSLQNFFFIDRYDRDLHHTRNAFNDFSKLVYNYPDSSYATDATKRMIYLKNKLAKYEYSVASYYANRNAWVAVVNRVEGMLQNYSDTVATRDALKLMEKAYRQMQLHIQADKVAKIISVNKKKS